jgi:DNA-nicking Smr family endonuclease
VAKHRLPVAPAGGGATDAARASDDALAFRAAVSDVKPLAQTELPKGAEGALAKPRTRVRQRAIAAASADEFSEALTPPDDGSPLDSSSAGAAVLAFRRPGVRTQVLRRLRRGLYQVEDELDLHGLSQRAARDELAEFIALSRHARHRCVRIIHGKGYRSGGRGPILKLAVNTWLRHHADVLAFTSARAIDGGTGALYVLLRT